MLVNPERKTSRTFAQVATVFLAYNVLVIAWGAWVRISFSGDGCGTSWPMCGDTLIPEFATKARWIEWTHRASTGVFGLWALAMFVWGKRRFAKKHPMHAPMLMTLLLTLAEALIGALLVKLELVADNQSVARVWIMGVHQITSLTLTGSIFFTVLYARASLPVIGKDWVVALPVLAFFAATSFSGALAALAGTLFPSMDLISGILSDFDPSSHVFVRLRLAHPFMATFFCIFAALWIVSMKRSLVKARNMLYVFLAGNFAFGLATLLSLSPVWMKILHLVLAHVLCVSLLYAIPPRSSENPSEG